MARARNIKPGFFDNEVLSELDPLARLLFIGLWCIADREGRLEDRPKRIKKEILGYDSCDCDELLDVLAGTGFILRYSANNSKYIQILNFKKHQKPHQNETASVIPAPDLLPRYEASTTKEISTRADSLLSDSLLSDCCESGARGADVPPDSGTALKTTKRFKKPTVDEVSAYCRERRNGIDPEAFIAHYASKGWRIGNTPMRDWKSAIITWEKNRKTDSPPFGAQLSPAKSEAPRMHRLGDLDG